MEQIFSGERTDGYNKNYYSSCFTLRHLCCNVLAGNVTQIFLISAKPVCSPLFEENFLLMVCVACTSNSNYVNIVIRLLTFQYEVQTLFHVKRLNKPEYISSADYD